MSQSKGGLRRFSTADETIASQWSSAPLTTDLWTIVGAIGSSESRPFHVRRTDGVRGIAKPAFDNTGLPRAAHERVAAELAMAIGLPVPPITLWQNPEGGERYAISLRAFAQPLTWHEAALAGALTSHFLTAAGPILALGYVFHSWIGDTDHDRNPGNALIDADCDPAMPGIAFMDHAFSMSRTWTTDTPPMRRPAAYFVKPSLLAGADLAEAITRIEGVTSDAIEKVVNDVPRDFLPQGRAELIAKGLVHSRNALRGSFS